MSLLIAIVCSGSMNTVFPVEDSSWMMPGTLRLCSAATTKTILPFLIDSRFSTKKPFSLKAINSCLKTLAASLSLFPIALEILSSSSEALGLTSPSSSKTRSISLLSLASMMMERPISVSFGYNLCLV